MRPGGRPRHGPTVLPPTTSLPPFLFPFPQIRNLGYDRPALATVRQALRACGNNTDRALDYLLQSAVNSDEVNGNKHRPSVPVRRAAPFVGVPHRAGGTGPVNANAKTPESAEEKRQRLAAAAEQRSATQNQGLSSTAAKRLNQYQTVDHRDQANYGNDSRVADWNS